MKSIEFRCRECHSVLDLPANRVEILYTHDVNLDALLGFRCPACGPRLQPLTTAQVIVLLGAGVEARGYSPEQPVVLPALTYDDLLDFHERLDTVDASVAELLDGAA